LNNDLRLAHHEGRCAGYLGVRKEDGEDKGTISTLESGEIRGFVVLRSARAVSDAIGGRSFRATAVPLISTMVHTHDGECATGSCY